MKEKRRKPNRDFMLYSVSGDSEDITEYDLDLDDKFVSSGGIYSDLGDGLMGLVGFFTDDHKGGIGGTFFYTIDQETLDRLPAAFMILIRIF
ncbi:MAG: hypothetical protein U5L96_19520 [Owenweeksia sp.]|nr:hypothetical protein [Owenweeksia sp.]